jgi:hypothetical protein
MQFARGSFGGFFQGTNKAAFYNSPAGLVDPMGLNPADVQRVQAGCRGFRFLEAGSYGGIFFSLLHIGPHRPSLPIFTRATEKSYDLA